MVVFFHATNIWSEHVAGTVTAYGWTSGAGGVDLFFVISGIVMTISSRPSSTEPHPARRFLERRAVRVIPLYWLVTGVFLLKQLAVRLHPAMQNSSEHVQTPLGYILASLFFIPYRNSHHDVQPLLAVGWSLSYEMFFYLLFALAMALRIPQVRLLTPVMLGLTAISFFRPDSWPAITVFASPLLAEFLAGVWLGWALQQGYRMNARWAAVLGLLGLATILTVPLMEPVAMRLIEFGLPAFFLVLAAMTLEEAYGHRLPRWMLLIGDSSYSLYLSHPLVFAVMTGMLIRLGLLSPGRVSRWGELACVVIMLVVVIPFSLCLYRWVEWPINDRLRRWLRLRPVQVSTAI